MGNEVPESTKDPHNNINFMGNEAIESTKDPMTDYQLVLKQLGDFIIGSDRPLTWLDMDPIASEIIEKYPNSNVALFKELLQNNTIEYSKEDNRFVTKPIIPSVDTV